MSLNIETFSNVSGGYSAFKAIGHPAVAEKAAALLEALAEYDKVAVYDPLGFADAFAELHDCSHLPVSGCFVQNLDHCGNAMLGRRAQPVTDLSSCDADAVFVTAFDSARLVDHIRHLLPAGAKVFSLDDMRLDETMLTNARRYLDPINFATNFAFFRDTGSLHTRLVTANYWSGYGAKDTKVWCRLFSADGAALAEWTETLDDAVETISIDSKDVRERFGLGDFTGQLFLHVINGAGHDVVKYALDTYGDNRTELSCTHDANAWPADLYGGLPAPEPGETVVLWVQNSHPCTIPGGSVGLNRMGTDDIAWLKEEVPAFGSVAVDVAKLLPDVAWPAHLEIRAGKHFVRPRYEVTTDTGRIRISHPNVERTDLETDPKIPELGNLMGKGYLLPAPVLPLDRFKTTILPTPMSTAQRNLPVTAVFYDKDGREVARHAFGCLPRDHQSALDADGFVNGNLSGGYGHVELVYDFNAGGEADGWLHSLFRYRDRHTGHGADTSFGAHIFNSVLTYRNEPQSYAGPAPGLSTRLFLRLGQTPHDTLCHLIYPASTPWHETSQTTLALHAADGSAIAERQVKIACGGSLCWRYSETFTESERDAAGNGAYVMIRDLTCRLFGYHGLLHGEHSFSLDHMFGF